jgi:hydroxymethylpyrimidine pyrophosphatase-like HAD family hydrolase
MTIEEFIKDRENYESRNLYKIFFHFTSADMALKAKKILSEFDMRDYIAVRSWDISLEIIKKENAKGCAIKRLKEALGVKTVIAAGDYENDIEMLKAADIGYAVENATEDLKAVADRITVHAKDSALAKIISDIELELSNKDQET